MRRCARLWLPPTYFDMVEDDQMIQMKEGRARVSAIIDLVAYNERCMYVRWRQMRPVTEKAQRFVDVKSTRSGRGGARTYLYLTCCTYVLFNRGHWQYYFTLCIGFSSLPALDVIS